MGWVYMAPKAGHPGIIQKTGGGGGFITYMAMVPQHNVGICGRDALAADPLHPDERWRQQHAG